MVGKSRSGGWRLVMRLGRFGAVLGLSLLLVAPGGCAGQSTGGEEEGPDCVELCQRGKSSKCPMSELLLCEDHCLGEDFRVEQTGCRGEYDATLECTAALENICAVRTECDSELDALLACYREYCEDHPAATTCVMG